MMGIRIGLQSKLAIPMKNEIENEGKSREQTNQRLSKIVFSLALSINVLADNNGIHW